VSRKREKGEGSTTKSRGSLERRGASGEKKYHIGSGLLTGKEKKKLISKGPIDHKKSLLLSVGEREKLNYWKGKPLLSTSPCSEKSNSKGSYNKRRIGPNG